MTDEVVAPDPAVIEQNTSGVVGVLAEALAQHQLASLLYDEGRCACGYWFDVADDPHSDRIRRMHREHVASVVAALPNIAIVPLPEPDFGVEQSDHRWLEWSPGESAEVFLTKGTDQIVYSSGRADPRGDAINVAMDAREATEVASGLLAAARAARAAGGQA